MAQSWFVRNLPCMYWIVVVLFAPAGLWLSEGWFVVGGAVVVGMLAVGWLFRSRGMPGGSGGDLGAGGCRSGL